jgi:hypothetical protein
MFQQGTLGDTQRGPIGSTSQRESPSAVFGVSTPGRPVYQGGLTESDIKKRIAAGSIAAADVNVIGRKGGHSIVLDDGNLEGDDQLVRIRTAGGHQITMSDDGNFFYIIHANGQAWLEFGQEGTVDVYATNSVNVRTQGTINLHADKDINMFAGGTINMKSMTGTTLESERTITLASNNEMTLYSKARIGVRADGSLAVVSNNGSWNAGGAMVLRAGGIDLNGGSAENVEPPVKLEKRIMPDTEFNNATGWQISATGLESRSRSCHGGRTADYSAKHSTIAIRLGRNSNRCVKWLSLHLHCQTANFLHWTALQVLHKRKQKKYILNSWLPVHLLG